MEKTCYMCDRIATSKEHVPPKCLFPKGGERITVPSCDLHNGKKSDDDEYLMLFLTRIFGVNAVATEIANTKVYRALQRKEIDFDKKQVLIDPLIFKSIFRRNDIVKVGKVNIERFLSCLDKIALGVYFAEYDKKFEGSLDALGTNFLFGNPLVPDINKHCEKWFVNEEIRRTRLVESAVFDYGFSQTEHGVALKITFYENCIFYYLFRPIEVRSPFHWVSKIEYDKNGDLNFTSPRALYYDEKTLKNPLGEIIRLFE